MTYTYPMIVIEIPHQTRPTVWMCPSEDFLLGAAYSEILGHPASAEDAIDTLGMDLSDLMLVTRDTIEAALRGDPHRPDGGHKFAEYVGRLREEAEDLGWIASQATAEEDPA